MNFKDFFYFSPRERRGILILIVLIAGVFIGKYLFGGTKNIPQQAVPANPIPKTETPTPQAEPQKPPQEEKRTYYTQPTQANKQPKSDKYPAGTVIDLNQADSLMLCKVPGIGPSYSKRIIAYRNLLGGYYKMEQLQEVYGMYVELYEKITPFFSVTPDSIRKIAVNEASVDRLKRHPYINFYQAKAIEDLRKKKGTITSLDEIRMLEPFDGSDNERIFPYLEL